MSDRKTLLALFDEAIRQAPEWRETPGVFELSLKLADGRELVCETWQHRPNDWRAYVTLIGVGEMHGRGRTKADAFRVAVRRLSVHH